MSERRSISDAESNGRLGLVVLDEVAELGVLLLADRLLERDRVLGHAQDLAHLVGRHLELLGDLLGQRLAAEALDELALDVDDLVQLLDHVHRDPDRARLVGDRTGHRLADPPGRVGRELEALAVVELLDRPDQARASPPGSGRGTRARGRGSPSRSRRRGAGSPRSSASSRPCRRARSAWRGRPPGRRSGAAPCRSRAGRAAASRATARRSGRASGRSSPPRRAAPRAEATCAAPPRRARRRGRSGTS